ncbi:MAG: hypothetical protein P1T08_03445 [Acidimicrobiia bacterium]|nr:hypothetical protein [Acidimicrobiia bacterium]
MPPQRRPEIAALRVRQWLSAWDEVLFDPAQHRRRPPDSFFVLSMQATQLRALCDIRRRTTRGQRARKTDLGIQRRHNEEHSHVVDVQCQPFRPVLACTLG